MEPETTPVATVTGLYRGTAGGLEPLTKDTPLTQDEVRDAPVFFELELAEDTEDADLIIDISLRQHAAGQAAGPLPGHRHPPGIRFWPDWFEIPPYREMRDVTGRNVYPRAPGIHTVRIRTARRLRSQPVRTRDFSPANRGYTSPLFELAIAAEADDG